MITILVWMGESSNFFPSFLTTFIASPSTIPHKTHRILIMVIISKKVHYIFFSRYCITDSKTALPSPTPSPRPVRVQSGC